MKQRMEKQRNKSLAIIVQRDLNWKKPESGRMKKNCACSELVNRSFLFEQLQSRNYSEKFKAKHARLNCTSSESECAKVCSPK